MLNKVNWGGNEVGVKMFGFSPLLFFALVLHPRLPRVLRCSEDVGGDSVGMRDEVGRMRDTYIVK